MPNAENVIHHSFKPGESGNPAGRPKGSRGRSAIVRQVLGMQNVLPDKVFADLKRLYPEVEKRMTIAEVMTIVQANKAVTKQDTAAYRAIMDYAPEQLEEMSEMERVQKYVGIRDSIIDKHYRFLEKGFDWSIEEGGSRSGKSLNAVKWCVLQTLKGKFDLNLIAPSYKMLANGMFLDVKNVINEFDLPVQVPKQATRIDMPNGSSWVFEIVTNENEAKRNRGNVIVDEADGVPKEVGTLLGRANGRKIILFNPVKKFWAHDFMKYDNVLHTTWNDNPYIPEPQLLWLQGLKEKGENAEEGSPERYLYEVYYLGNYSILSGKAYEMEDFDIVDQIPDKFDYMISYADPSLGTGNDFFAALLFGIKGTQVYAVDCIFSQFVKSGGYTEKLKEWDRDYKTAIDHYAEANGVGGVVTGAVQEFYHGVLNEVSNSTKKEADIIVYAPTAKKFKFVRSAKMIEFLIQCAEFPNAEHDDAPDCLSRGAKLILKYFDI